MSIKKIDYSLYLVTDRSLVPEGKTFLGQIERALEGGVTLVQLREKDTETGPFIDFARKVKELTRRYGVPLIINDRLDVAQAVDAEGVHIGQDDMPLKQARAILGPKKIIGVSCNTEEEAAIAIRDGADYLGIGAVWFTSTKKNIKEPLGIEGVKKILKSMESNPVPTVAIGGIGAKNACELLEGSNTGKIHVDGLAIVSAIMAAEDPKIACEELLGLVRKSLGKMGVMANNTVEDAVKYAIQAAKNIKAKTPMVHHITNYVVINDNANATLAVGASPIMSTNRDELRDLAAVNGAMLLNMGTLNDVDSMILAAQANAEHKNPVVLDPVGCGATKYRKGILQRFLTECDLTVVKGNAGEILSMAGVGGKSRGVDSVGNSEEEVMVNAVKTLAKQNNCIIGLTGSTDYVSDGDRVFAIENGDKLLPLITGSGCMVSSVVACFAAANRDDYLLSTVAGILTVTVASEIAAAREYVNGPGTFRAALIDELYNVTNSPEILCKYAKIRVIQ
ncbi:MAG: Hydroxyethylthiazole kinase family-domain-containing protein [Benjaminiella poitrasii]|nr:MAG: Hydroxyethylthiazole kinase family-domain-containing protein [Benjaminiella poitrasii]